LLALVLAQVDPGDFGLVESPNCAVDIVDASWPASGLRCHIAVACGMWFAARDQAWAVRVLCTMAEGCTSAWRSLLAALRAFARNHSVLMTWGNAPAVAGCSAPELSVASASAGLGCAEQLAASLGGAV
jgi:uncharacterized repeat protein (TIGR04076 family)